MSRDMLTVAQTLVFGDQVVGQHALLPQGIVRKLDILLLDEPAAGLDRSSVARARQVLAEEAVRVAIVVCVSHDVDAVTTADRVIRLDRVALIG